MKQITYDTLMALADAYANHRMIDGAQDKKASAQSVNSRAALSTALTELVAERDKWKRGYDALKFEYDDLYDRHEVVLAERDALREYGDEQTDFAIKNANERDALALDAARYQFLRMRLKVQKMAAVSGGVRKGIEVKVGCSFLDSKLPHTIPETYPIEQAEKLDAAIDAAMKDTP